jgi:hypothetical protein
LESGNPNLLELSRLDLYFFWMYAISVVKTFTAWLGRIGIHVLKRAECKGACNVVIKTA